MALHNCNICGKPASIDNGGCAMQMAFIRKGATTLTNVSFCAECYDNLLREKFKAFVDAANMEVGGLEG